MILTTGAKDARGVKLVNNVQLAASRLLVLRIPMSTLSLTAPSIALLLFLVRQGHFLGIHGG